jgi:SAM-dependent methyltransferase
MNYQKFFAIAHRDHDYGNPLSAAKFERLLDLLPLDDGSRVLDLGCRRAELSLRIIERFGATVIAVDSASLMLDAARERAEWTGALGKLHLDSCDVRDFQADPETFHLTQMLDAVDIVGGMPAVCEKLKGWTRSGGHVLVGLNYWKGKPAPELAATIGARGKDITDHRGNVQAGVDAGLIPVHAVTAADDEWDEYEWKLCRSIERYAREQPEDPDVPAMIEHSRRLRDAYLRWGRDGLGFGAYLFYRPGPRLR